MATCAWMVATSGGRIVDNKVSSGGTNNYKRAGFVGGGTRRCLRSVRLSCCHGGTFLPKDRTVQHLSKRCTSDGAVPQEWADGLLLYDEQNNHGNTLGLKLLCGSYYVPYYSNMKEIYELVRRRRADGNVTFENRDDVDPSDDLVTKEEVAEGVGGRANQDDRVNADFSEIMHRVKMIPTKLNRDDFDPSDVLQIAHIFTMDLDYARVVIPAFKNQNLHVILFGVGSGFIVVRDGKSIIRQYPVQTFLKLPLEPEHRIIRPRFTQMFDIPVEPDDAIIFGNHGFFRDLTGEEVAAIVRDAMSENLSPNATAQKIVVIARERALDRRRRYTAARAAGQSGVLPKCRVDSVSVSVAFVSKA